MLDFPLNKLSENAFLNGNDQDQRKTNPNVVMQFWRLLLMCLF